MTFALWEELAAAEFTSELIYFAEDDYFYFPGHFLP